jgi:hypothetical protein
MKEKKIILASGIIRLPFRGASLEEIVEKINEIIDWTNKDYPGIENPPL